VKNNTQIKCPSCSFDIDVQDVLSHQLEAEIRGRYQMEFQKKIADVQGEQEKLKQEKEAFENKKKQENQIFQERLEKQLKEQKQLMESELRKKLDDEQSERLKAYQKELEEKSQKLAEMHKLTGELERVNREKNELRSKIEAEAQIKLSQELVKKEEEVRKIEKDKTEMKVLELQKKLEDQIKLTEEMQRKQQQGSMQLQGEVQELAIEQWLTTQFPLDSIEEIKKGQRGGDCIQTVNSYQRPNCGIIYYESKRTKEFSQTWVEKFKADMRDRNADIGVLVTEAMPSGMDRMGLRDGIWICNFDEFKGLSAVLRETVIKLSLAAGAQENKGDKMHMLYDYLTSGTFRMQVEAIVEGFTYMKTALDSEKRAMNRIWKEREKQIEKVIINTTEMYGSIKGIAGNAIQAVSALELPGYDDDDLLD
jgi:hypothetical protein